MLIINMVFISVSSYLHFSSTFITRLGKEKMYLLWQLHLFSCHEKNPFLFDLDESQIKVV